jgi:hypothetical protein
VDKYNGTISVDGFDLHKMVAGLGYGDREALPNEHGGEEEKESGRVSEVHFLYCLGNAALRGTICVD